MMVESALDERSHWWAALEASLREVLFQIIKFVNEKKRSRSNSHLSLSIYIYNIALNLLDFSSEFELLLLFSVILDWSMCVDFSL